MSEREYVVSLVPGVDYDQFWHEMEHQSQALPTVPDRAVTVSNERPGSLRSCHYMLTDAEAAVLAQDARVYSVEIPPDQRTDIRMGFLAQQFSVFDKTTSSSGSFVNWGLRRSNSATNVYQTGTTAPGAYDYTLDGTGVDVVIQDSGIQTDHPEFLDSEQNSRVQLINWYTESGIPGTQSANFYRDRDGHGTHVAGIAVGASYGWAKNSRIYSVKVAGLEGSGDSGTGISVANCFDVIKLWHQNKPVDPITGVKRPTVVNMSWGYMLPFDNITGGNYRGTVWTGTSVRPEYGMVGTLSGGVREFVVRVGSVDSDLQELIDAGVHVTVAAGNSYQKVDVPSGDDYDNYFTSSVYGNIAYHRGGSPYSDQAITVGSVDSTVFDVSTEYKSVFSESGPGVMIYAPGSNIVSATSTVNSWGGNSQNYYLNSSYRQTNLSGTSMAAPQVAGVLCLYLQLNPWATPDQARAWLLHNSQSVIYNTGSSTDYTNDRSIKGSENRMLYNPFNQEHPLITSGVVGIQGLSL